jgi:hypothetical protein
MMTWGTSRSTWNFGGGMRSWTSAFSVAAGILVRATISPKSRPERE